MTPERLRRQLIGLMSRGYRPWPLRRALECHRSGKALPARTFIVTFDDGYDNVYHNAWPLLKELSVPATIFVTTAYLDDNRPFAFDDWSAAGSDAAPEVAWKPLTTAHCSEMIESELIEIGSHTHTHADLRGRAGMFRRDLVRSIELLHDRFGLSDVSFAFPYGYYGSEMIAATRDAGAKCALTAEPKVVLSRDDPFAWGRFTVARYDTAATLKLKLNGWYSVLRSVWRRLRPSSELGKSTLPGKLGKLSPTHTK